ncbi:hypothetical protein GIB67_004422 [Kingdonia uniflora]|uniref:glucose-6-phosphate 1-epimerase n=1 Tax=Kingdonia uniflora TaxID=39325 RepID=A0A7J7MRK2_9MAGN|nr:hypothetical protein GIB67_004422 [Kingdonia uniflora]
MRIFKGKDGLKLEEIITLKEPRGSSAKVLVSDGQVISWKNDCGEELLFTGSKTITTPWKALRGISVWSPQFRGLETREHPGLTKKIFWTLDNNSQSSVDLILKLKVEDLKTWPQSFELRLRISLSAGKLTLIPGLRNTNKKAFPFNLSLRNYLSVSDISEIRVEGLETLDYLDNLVNKERFTEQADAITFDSKVDRVYLSTPTKIAIIDHEKKRTFELRKGHLADAVVWNPWERKDKGLHYLDSGEYKNMLCVESAVIEKPILLQPGNQWNGCQELSIVSSSYYSGQLDPRKVLNGYK